MSRVGPISQDWEPVVVRKKLPNAAAKKDEKVVNAARRAGADIDIVKKRKHPSRTRPFEPLPRIRQKSLGAVVDLVAYSSPVGALVRASLARGAVPRM
jgi:hypothetical protein